MKYDIMEVLREKKTLRRGLRFRPSIASMLKELADKQGSSMADYLDRLIVDLYLKEFDK